MQVLVEIMQPFLVGLTHLCHYLVPVRYFPHPNTRPSAVTSKLVINVGLLSIVNVPDND